MRAIALIRLHYSAVYIFAAAILGGAIFSIPPAIEAMRLLWMQIMGKTAIACGCTILPNLTHPLLLVSIILISALLLFLSIRILYSMYSTLRSTRTLIKEWSIVSTHDIQFAGKTFQLCVVQSDYPLLCSAGIRTSRIYISTTTLHLLSNNELCAGVLHEIGHITKHHPLAYTAFTAVCRALFLSRFTSLQAQHAFVHEHSADQFALRYTSRAHVLSAITKFVHTNAHKPLVVPQFSLEESRMKMLIGQHPQSIDEKTTLLLCLLTLIAIGCTIPFTLFARSDTLAAAQWQSEAICAYVAPPPETYLCIEDAGQTILFYQHY